MEHTCIQVPYGFPRRSFFDKRQPLESSSGADLQPLKLWNPQRERVSEALTSETLVFGGDEKIHNSVIGIQEQNIFPSETSSGGGFHRIIVQ